MFFKVAQKVGKHLHNFLIKCVYKKLSKLQNLVTLAVVHVFELSLFLIGQFLASLFFITSFTNYYNNSI